MRSYGYPLHPKKLEYFADALQNSVGGAESYYRMEKHPVIFDPFTLVGHKTEAGEITKTDAEMMKKIWDGPAYYPGFQPGQKNWNKIIPIGWFYYPLFGKWPKPFPLADIWARWVTGNPKQKFDDITPEELEELFDASSKKFANCNADNADLRPFAARGGKLMIDHGWDDPLIPTMGTIDYYRRMLKIHGGREAVDAFCRLYITPGDNHGNCRGNGPGITQTDGIKALMDWVEKGIAPEDIRVVQVHPKTGETICERTQKPYTITEG